MLPTKQERVVFEKTPRAPQTRTRVQRLFQDTRSLFGSTLTAAMASFLLTLLLYSLLPRTATQNQASEVLCTSPPKFLQTYGLPGTWDDAKALAIATTNKLTLDEKVGVLIGKGLTGSRCIGDTGPVARLNIPNLCMNDGPAG